MIPLYTFVSMAPVDPPWMTRLHPSDARHHLERPPFSAEGRGVHGAQPAGLAAVVCHWEWILE